MKSIKIIAHRGGYKESNTIENSIESIKYAVKQDYIYGIEFDVRMTKDKQIILFHDPSIKYNNKRYFIYNTDYDTLNKLNLESYNTKLVKLEEVLAIIPKQKTIFLEVKNAENDSECEYLSLIYNIIRKYPTKKFIIISFIYKYLKYFTTMGYETGYLLNRKFNLLEIKTYLKLWINKKIKIITISKKILSPKMSDIILRKNKDLGIYTIEKGEEVDMILNKIGLETVNKYKDNIYITTDNMKEIYERIKFLDEKDKRI